MTDQEGFDLLDTRLANARFEKWNREQPSGDVSVYSDFASLTMAVANERRGPKISVDPAITASREFPHDYDSWLSSRASRSRGGSQSNDS
jgi:hypothetical protein